jgi:RNA polymerase sigma-70 factor (ECF subfamily)
VLQTDPKKQDKSAVAAAQAVSLDKGTNRTSNQPTDKNPKSVQARPSDAELVRMTLQDPEKFALIIERYEQKLMRYLNYFTGANNHHAEDIFQETMIKVYRNLNGFDKKLSFSSWIYRIAHNEALNYLRKNRQQAAVSLEAEDEASMSLLKVLASEENVMMEAARKETSGKVREVLKRLREDYREVLILRYLEDYDYNEISYVLKKPLGTVGVLLARAKNAFKELAIKHNLLKYE